MAICPKSQISKNRSHKVFTDVLDNIPYLFVFQSLFMGNHAGPLGTILDDPEHLARRNFLHRCFAGEIPRLGRQGFAQFAIARTFVTMAHFASHRLGGFGINLFTIGFIGLGCFIDFSS